MTIQEVAENQALFVRSATTESSESIGEMRRGSDGFPNDLLVAIAATAIAFWPRSLAAGILMGWVAFASLLNFAIWRLN